MNMGQIAPPPTTPPPSGTAQQMPPPTTSPPMPPTGGGFTSGQSPMMPMGVPNTNTPTDNDGGSQIFNTANTNNSGWLSKVMPQGGGIGAAQSRPPMMAGQIIR